MNRIIVTFVAGICSAVHCFAGNAFYVDAEHGDDAADGSMERPRKTLVKVMELVTPGNGDIVYAAPGVYSNLTCEVGGITYRVSVPEGTTLKSTGTRENTIILGESDGGVGGSYSASPYGCGPKAVRCGYLGANARIEGFTITGGRDSATTGSASVSPGGLLGANKSTCFAVNCIFSNNVTKCRGAALGYITSVGCYFANNRAGEGNADAFQNCDAYNCVFGPTPNYHAFFQCNFYNCTFFGKTARSLCKIYNSLIFSEANHHTGNANSYYNCLYTELHQDAVKDSCRQIALSEVPYDPVTYAPLAGSAAINAGDNSYVKPSFDAAYSDYLGHPRVYGDTVDVGAVEARAMVRVSDVSGLDFEGLSGTSTMIPPDGLKVRISRNYSTVKKVKGIRINGGELFEFEGESADRVYEGTFADGTDVSIEVVYVEKNDWYVDAVNGDDSNDGYTPYRARKTLAAAMALPYLAPGEIVHAAAGVYDEGEMYSTYVDSSFHGSNRVVVAAGVGLVATNASVTLIKGRPHDETDPFGTTCVRCVFLEDGAWVENFTVTNGFARGKWASAGAGGGICSVTNNPDGTDFAGGAAVGCRIIGCSAKTNGKLVYGGVYIRCYFEDTIGHLNNNHQIMGTEALIGSVVKEKITVHGPVAILNSTLYGNLNHGSVYNSYVFYNAGHSHFYSSRLYYENAGDDSSDDKYTTVGITKHPAFDANHRPALDDALYCDAGDRNWYDTLFPERWARFKGKDYSGGQRIYNGKIDIGAGEADWRGVYTSAFSAKRTSVAAAGANVTAGVKSLNLKAGDSVVLRINVTKRGMLSLKIVSDGLVSVKCGEIEAQRNGEEFSFAVEPGTVDVTVFASDAEATVSSVKLPIGGVVLSVR